MEEKKVVYTSDIEVKGSGRPFSERALQLQDILQKAVDLSEPGMSIPLQPDEAEYPHRFVARVRSAAEKKGLKVRVSYPHKDDEFGKVRIIGNVQ